MTDVSPRLRDWLAGFNAIVAELDASGVAMTPERARAATAKMNDQFAGEGPAVALVRDAWVLSRGRPIPVRLYHPDPGVPLPVLVFYHGGGHMTGSVAVYDALNRRLAEAARHLVVAVEYRLAPEYPYPAGLDDAYDLLRELWPLLDGLAVPHLKRLSVAGDSGGGALAASVAARAQFDPAVRIQRQALFYPSLDYTMSSSSIEENGQGLFLQKRDIVWFFRNYLGEVADRRAISPLFQDITENLPETLVVTVGLCPLRDEGLRYLERLHQTGVATRHLHFEDMLHAFLNLHQLVPEECDRLYRVTGEFLNQPLVEAG